MGHSRLFCLMEYSLALYLKGNFYDFYNLLCIVSKWIVYANEQRLPFLSVAGTQVSLLLLLSDAVFKYMLSCAPRDTASATTADMLYTFPDADTLT